MNWREVATNTAEESLVWINGVLLQSLGIDVRISSNEPIVPNLRNQIIPIPNLSGAYDMGAELEPRVFTYNCVFPRENTYADLRCKARDFVTMFFDEYGRPKDVELRTGDAPEMWYTVRITSGISPELIAKRGIVTIELTAFDPYLYAPATYYDPDFIAEYDTDVYYDDGETEYKNQTGTEFINPRQYAGVFNYSHYATPFSFMIEGYVKNPKITNQTSGKSARINVEVGEHERLYFDSRLQTVWKVGKRYDEYFWLTPYFMMGDEFEWAKINRYHEMTGDFIELVSGDNSLLFEGGNPDAEIEFEWLHRFI